MSDKTSILALYGARRDELVNYALQFGSCRMLAEDIVQDAYLRIDRLDDQRALIDPIGYLYRIVQNLALDVRRREIRENKLIAHTDGRGETVVDDYASPEAEIIAREDLQLLSTALAELPERTRIAIEMHRLGGCRLKEIAAHLGISITAAHDHIIKGVEHCRRRVYTRG